MNKAIIDGLLSGKKLGFQYKFLTYRDDKLIAESPWECNLIPTVGIEYIISAALRGGAQFSTWYIGLTEGNYTPQADDTMTDYPTSATELTTSYTGVRQTLTPDALDAGLYSNAGAPAEFPLLVDKTVRGAFISSGSVKGGTTGILLSAVLASSPKVVAAGETLKVITGLNITV